MNFRKALPTTLLALAFLTPGASAITTGRRSHTTTLLPNGNILITGGITSNGGAVTSSAEIYNMVTAAWTSPGNINNDGAVTLASHTATLLSNGKVLIAGGYSNAGTPQSNAYLYDPSAATWAAAWSATGSLGVARGGHTATLISKGDYAGNVLICGGRNAGGVLATCVMYNGADFTTITVPTMSSSRIGHTAGSVAGGRVFFSGGQDNAGTYLPTNEIYDPDLNQWQSADALLQGRSEHSAVVLNNGLVMISGGFNNVRQWSCAAGDKITDKECWYISSLLHGDDVGATTRQNPGTQGFLDGAEFFTQNGARVVLSEKDFGVAPFRFFRHSAALLPDGTHHAFGGYGNIVPTYFMDDPVLEEGSYLTTTPTTVSTVATISGGTFRFQLNIDLAREVSGRFVNADAFFSKPPVTRPLTPSLLGPGVSIFLGYTTATLDGFPVGILKDEYHAPGTFDNLLQITAPTSLDGGQAVFTAQSVAVADTFATAGTLFFTPATLTADDPPVPLTGGSMTLPVTIQVPIAYLGGVITGKVVIIGGNIAKSDGAVVWTTSLIKSTWNPVMVDFISGPVTPDLTDPTMGLATDPSVTFTALEGTIQNTSATITTGGTGEDFAGQPITGLSVTAYYTSSRISLYDEQNPVAFIFDTSTMVVREMIFSGDLEYKPDANEWEIHNDTKVMGGEYVPPLPVFNHSVLLTPAADAVVIGGRNCEAPPYTDCLRAAKTFTHYTADAGTVYTPENFIPWEGLEPLNTRRAFHTSTLLPDDRIVTCGGTDGVTTLNTCEIWDPVLQTWSYTGSMLSPRARHTATLLPNGNILLAGGGINSSSYSINTAELYDPVSGRCSNTGSMADKRAGFTATLLPNGNVLAAGGNTISGSGNSYLDTAEIYFTTRALWVPLVGAPAVMTTERAQHTATLMKDGNVLVAGGVNGLGATNSAEVFISASQSWAAAADPTLTTARYAHTANLLRDGRVLIIGGSNNNWSLDTQEIYNGASWTQTEGPFFNRTSHNSTLLPNGKVMVTGGETPGYLQSSAENFNPDFMRYTTQGRLTNRANHTTVLTSTGLLVAIGGWNGSTYLDSTEASYFSYGPDSAGLVTNNERNPSIGSGTTYFARGETVTLLSGATNFHGITEASGGGSGAMNSSHHNPRVYIQAVDRLSGFLTDLTTRLYTAYGGPNSDWEATLSSISVIVPATPGELPYGWYHMHVANNGQFSRAHTVQVTMPRPLGYVTAPTTIAVYNSSVTWYWTNAGNPPLSGEVNGYNVFAASNSVLLGTAAFGGTASFTQTGLASNTEVSVMVNGYNLGGGGPLMHSATYYSLPAQPTDLTITEAGFDHVDLTWNPNGNSDITVYELSISSGSDFGAPADIDTPFPFASNLLSTAATVSNLLPNIRYYFRVRATNGRWPVVPNITSDYNTPHPSTVTVSSVNNLQGTPAGSYSITWAWDDSVGADFYNVYAIGDSTETRVWLDSTTANSYTQLEDSNGLTLHPNVPYSVAVEAAKNDVGYGEPRGPLSYSLKVHTLAMQPTLGANPLAVTTTTLTANWITNGNSTFTVYTAELSLSSGFEAPVSTTVITSSVTFRNLTPNQLYYVRISVQNKDNLPNPATLLSLGAKYTLAASPTNVNVDPVTGVSMSGVTLTWSASNNTAGTIYRVRSSTHPPVIAPPQTPFEQGFSTYPSCGYYGFDCNFTGTSLDISGLLTSTTYYFDVTARNGESILTGPAQTSPAETFTLAGPDSAPSGSVAGTSNPSMATTITGTLPNGRIVSLSIPADAFPATTALAISSSNINRCDHNIPPLLPTIALELFSQDRAQPEAPVTLTFNYTASESTSGVTLNASNIVLARYNPANGDCLPLKTILEPGPRRITATLNHFSLFQLMVVPAVSNLDSITVYPNPFYRRNGYVTIANLPANTTVRIYTLSGAKVWEGSGGTIGVIQWQGTNHAGYKVASGIYLAVVDSPAGKKILKIAVER